ncbi:hydroxymethylbilane synthase [Actinotalea sp. JY-7876]|uniref:hydroxymethylbilane synthase n=2 Tax=unclassified Actinotalea TaxID=2638618 RepID=UPI0015F379D7|nr:hydroxymethylbilane synthase [Actinotalea sp. JY-7876]
MTAEGRPADRSALRLGTRGSALATTQTGMVADALRRLAGLAADDLVQVRVRTDGDRLTGSLASLGGTGVFVAALREAVLDDRCDLAVHSLKDLPTAPAPGLVVAAVPERVDPRDALCARDGLTLATLPPGARVGTGSPRRAAQLRALRPDLVVEDIRGNVDTRLGRVAGGAAGGPGAGGDLDAVVLAAAGLARLGRLSAVTDLLDPEHMAPAPGQGALAVECRPELLEGAGPVAEALRALDHLPTRLAVTAERTLLTVLEAGCAAPIGALGSVERATGAARHGAGQRLRLDAVVCAPDGAGQVRSSASVPLPAQREAQVAAARRLGEEVARHLLLAGAAELADLPGTLGPVDGGAPSVGARAGRPGEDDA